MSVHVAILKRPYLNAILDGSKTIESRLSRNAGPPFGLVHPGERVYLKVSAGPFLAFARAAAVHRFESLTPEDIAAIRRRYGKRIGGSDEYWAGRADCRYATLIELEAPQPCPVGPTYRVAHMKAWYALPDAADPVREVPLTAGAIRNGYVPLPADSPGMKTQRIKLLLPDGASIDTDSLRGHRFRWRGWRRYFTAHGVCPGDRVRLIALGARRYRVTFPDSI